MIRYSNRLLTSLVASLSLASCAPGGSSLPMAPSQSVQSASQAKNNGAGCKTLPFMASIDLMLDAKLSREHSAASDCSIRSFHAAAPRSNSGNIQVFDVPGAMAVSNCGYYEKFFDCGTVGHEINAGGTVAGYYLNTDDVIASFLRTSGGKYTTFQADGSDATYAYDISDNGASAGNYYDSQGVSHGFIRNKKGSFVLYDAPWASQVGSDSVPQGTATGALNNRGDSAGIYYDSQGLNHGFIRSRNGTFTQVIPSGALVNTVCITCINSRGTTAGDYTNIDGITRGYVRSAAGQIRTITVTGAVATRFSGINDANKLVGYYVDQSAVTWGLIAAGRKKQIAFQEPNACQTYGAGTQPEGINNGGAVTGLYVDCQGGVHGFYRSPTGQFSEFDPYGSVFTVARGIANSGSVTGYWYDAQGQAHGFIWHS